MTSDVVVLIGVLAAAAVLSPFLVRQCWCRLLAARLRRESEQVRQLKSELFRLDQVRGHWTRLAGELGSLDDAGRRAWLDSMRGEQGSEVKAIE